MGGGWAYGPRHGFKGWVNVNGPVTGCGRFGFRGGSEVGCGAMNSDGVEVARVPFSSCRCGSDNFTVIGDGADRQCSACGTVYIVVDEVERVTTADGTIERVHAQVERPLDDPDDRRVLLRINTGKDDQRPDHDPENGIYRPIWVAQHLSADGEIYTYLQYCGRCRVKWGSLGTGHDWVCCPYCATTIGNYVFADGLEHWCPGQPRHWGDGPPDRWPESSPSPPPKTNDP